MHSDNRAALREIEQNVRLAQQFVANLDLDSFSRDTRTIYAVIRCLEIISEASRRVPVSIKARHPSVPWKAIAAAGNIYRHEYEEVETPTAWNTVTMALPSLLAVVLEELQKETPPSSAASQR